MQSPFANPAALRTPSGWMTLLIFRHAIRSDIRRAYLPLAISRDMRGHTCTSMHERTYMQAHALRLDNDKCGVTVRLTVKLQKYI